MSAAPAVPLFDLRLTDEDLAAAEAVLRSGVLGPGPEVAAFEREFAAQLGARQAVAVSSCSAALELSYRAAGVGPGDEVVVPSFTFVATAAAAVHCGATPVFADVAGLDEPTLDPADVAARLTPRTRAVCCVHFAGYPARVEELRELCDARGLALIEDAAHAPSAPHAGRKLGTFGLAGCFSFFSNKVLSAGEGGLVATDDDAVAAHVRAQGDAGIDDVRAAILRSRLRRMEAEIAERRRLTRRYRAALGDVDGIVVPFAEAAVDASSCYVFPLMLADPARQAPLRRALRDRHGIQTSLLYPAAHELTAYRAAAASLPRTELAARSEVTLPLYAGLSDAEQDRVIAALREELGT